MSRTAPRLPDIDPVRCTGCGWCLAACKPAVLGFVHDGWRKFTVLQDAPACTGCTLCELRCPVHAITMRPADAVVSGTASPPATGPAERSGRR